MFSFMQTKRSRLTNLNIWASEKKNAFEHMQNVRIHIILHMCKVSSWPLLFINTPQPLYNMVGYNMVLDITRFKDGSQKCIDYIKK